MRNINILVAEDETNIRDGLIDALESEGYGAYGASDGDAAITVFNQKKVDLVLLDIMMPGTNGYDVCKLIREKNAEVPIIMLTAKGEEVDKVVGLKLGADDYMTKPFGIPELMARIGAALRRSRMHLGTKATKKEGLPGRFKFGEADIDTLQYQSRCGDVLFDLTPRELKLIEKFYRNPTRVLTREELLNDVWGIGYVGTTRTLDQHVAQLRKKIELQPGKPTTIVTVHGAGYKYLKR